MNEPLLEIKNLSAWYDSDWFKWSWENNIFASAFWFDSHIPFRRDLVPWTSSQIQKAGV